MKKNVMPTHIADGGAEANIMVFVEGFDKDSIKLRKGSRVKSRRWRDGGRHLQIHEKGAERRAA